MNHPTEQELFDYADGLLDPGSSAEVGAHIRGCARCARACEAALAVEGALRRLRPESPSARFTERLLNRLGLKEETPVWWLFMRNFAPVLAAGVLAGVVLMLGAGGGGDAGASAGKSLLDTPRIGDALKGAMDLFTAWTGSVVSKYLTFSVGEDSLSQMLFLLFLFAGIGLLDRFVLGPMLRRRN